MTCGVEAAVKVSLIELSGVMPFKLQLKSGKFPAVFVSRLSTFFHEQVLYYSNQIACKLASNNYRLLHQKSELLSQQYKKSLD